MDSENNQPSNEDNTTPFSTDPKRKKRKGRGSTRLSNVIKDRSSGVKKVIDYDDIGRPKGRNRPQFASYLGVLARTMVSIDYKDWFEVPEHIKDKLWMMVQVFQFGTKQRQLLSRYEPIQVNCLKRRWIIRHFLLKIDIMIILLVLVLELG